MSRRITAKLVWRTNTLPVGPRRVPRVELYTHFAGEAKPRLCQWDTGSELSLMSADVARSLGVDLARAEETAFVGANNEPADAWLVSRWVQFPGVDGYRFKLQFLVCDGADDVPLLGMLDTYQNFDAVSSDTKYYFLLAADRHRGEAC